MPLSLFANHFFITCGPEITTNFNQEKQQIHDVNVSLADRQSALVMTFVILHFKIREFTW
jgi:hypothetical protein